MEHSNMIDEHFREIGEIGKYQLFVFILVGLTSSIASLDSYAYVFTGAIPDYRCKLPMMPNDTFKIQGDYHRALVDKYIPPNVHGEGDSSFDGCHLKSYEDETNTTNFTLVACNASWVFSKQYFDETVVSEWNLVCHRTFERSLFSTLLFAGYFGAIVFGALSDKFGRKKVCHFLVVSNFVGNTILAIILNVPAIDAQTQQILFGACRLLIGLSSNIYIVAMVLGIEMLGPSYRLMATNSMFYFYILGEFMTLILAYFVRDYRAFSIYFAVIASLYLLYFWYLPESPRYLFARGRYIEAYAILKRIADSNGVAFEPSFSNLNINTKHYQNINTMSLNSIHSGHVSSKRDQMNNAPTFVNSMKLVFSSKVLLVRLLATIVNWFSNTLIYDGLSFNIGDLAGDPYLTFLYSSLVELSATIISQLLFEKIGRKKPYVCALFGAGVSLFIIQFVPKDMKTIITVFALMGKFFISFTFNGIYIVTAESYPTIIRNSVLALCSSLARFGGIIAPYIQLLGKLYNYNLPFIVYGSVAFVTAILYAFLIQETKGVELSENIADMINRTAPNTTNKHKRLEEEEVEVE